MRNQPPHPVGVHTISLFCSSHTYNKASSRPSWRYCVLLTYNVIYCFTLLATHSTKRRIHGLVNVALDIVCSRCLFLGCKNKWFSFNFQVTPPCPLPGLIFVPLSQAFPYKFTKQFFLFPSNEGGVLFVLFKFVLFLTPSLSFEFLTYIPLDYFL